MCVLLLLKSSSFLETQELFLKTSSRPWKKPNLYYNSAAVTLLTSLQVQCVKILVTGWA